VAVNGGVTKEFSHSWKINSQRYAYDFIIPDNEGKSCSGDSKIMSGGKTDPLVKDIQGNYVVIQHAENEYSCLAHIHVLFVTTAQQDL
jgi:hypothetical protein